MPGTLKLTPKTAKVLETLEPYFSDGQPVELGELESLTGLTGMHLIGTLVWLEQGRKLEMIRHRGKVIGVAPYGSGTVATVEVSLTPAASSEEEDSE